MTREDWEEGIHNESGGNECTIKRATSSGHCTHKPPTAITGELLRGAARVLEAETVEGTSGAAARLVQ